MYLEINIHFNLPPEYIYVFREEINAINLGVIAGFSVDYELEDQYINLKMVIDRPHDELENIRTYLSNYLKDSPIVRDYYLGIRLFNDFNPSFY